MSIEAGQQPWDQEPRDSLGLFDGDSGTLEREQRDVLVRLLRAQVLTAARHPEDFDALVRHRDLIVSRLHDLYLDLVLDPARGVAYKVQLRADGAAVFPSLLRESSYSREETVLLVHLRQARLAGRAAGEEHVFVDTEECLEALERYRPEHATDVVAEAHRARKAVLSLQAAGVLASTDVPERYLVTPVIEVILPVARLQELLSTLSQGQSEADATAETVNHTDAAEEDLD